MGKLNWEHLGSYANLPFPDGWPDDRWIYFSPRDTHIPDVIAAVLNSAQHSIRVNMYGYDSPELDTILQRKAADPDIYFQMSLDKTEAGGVHERQLLGPWAKAMGTTVAVGQSVKHAISHLKVAVIDGLYIVSGSTNWSVAGETKQDNELLVQRSPLVAARYSAILDINHSSMLRQMAAAEPSR